MFIYSHNRKKARIPIKGLKITSGNWTDKKFIKESEPTVLNVAHTNEILKGYDLKAMQTINRLASDNTIKGMNVTDLANEISLACFNSNKKQTHTFGTYTDTVIEQLKQAKKLGTADCYEDAKKFIVRRLGHDVGFSEITYQALKKMEADHYADGKSINGLSFYMRTIRAIYNRAIKDKLVNKEFSPFVNYSIKSERTAKRAISLDDVKKLKNIAIGKSKAMLRAQQYFLFSFYTRGMNFIDMAYLKVKNISETRIEYRRAKTGKLFSIQLTPQINEILSTYVCDKTPDQFVFPILKNEDPEQQRHDLENQRRNYNKMLVKLAKKANLSNSNITNYVARHSWATISKYAGLSIELISEGLGHSDVRTTEIYLDSFPDDIMDKAGLMIANLLDKPNI